MRKVGIFFVLFIFLTGCSAARPVIRTDQGKTPDLALEAETFTDGTQTVTGKEEDNKSDDGVFGPALTKASSKAEQTRADILSASDKNVGSQEGSSSNNTASGGDTSPSNPPPGDEEVAPEEEPAELSAYNLFDYYPLIADRRVDLKGFYGGDSSLILQYFYEEVGSAMAQIRQFNDNSALINVVRISKEQITELYYTQSIPYRHNIMGHTGYEERVILRAPLRKGNKWTSTGLDFEITAVDEERKINGKVETVLDVLVTTEDEKVLFTYAVGLGLVSNDIIQPDGSLTNIVQLSGFSEKVKDSYDITFYFPMDNGLTSVTRSVDFATNDSTREQLTTTYKAIAAEEGVTEVMGPDAQIQYIYLEEGLVHLDLNQAFVDYINQAPELENQRLEALVNTLAGYYRVDAVKLTINDQRYESLNRKIEPDELLTPTVSAELKGTD